MKDQRKILWDKGNKSEKCSFCIMRPASAALKI